MDFELIKTAIQTWAISIVPIETIFINQDGSIPLLPFCTLYIQPINFIGHDDFSVDDAGETTYIGQREFTVSIQYFGVGAMQNAHDLAESLEMLDARDLLASSNIVFADRVGGVNDLSELVDTGYEERAGVDLLFRIASIRAQSGGIVESTELTGEYIMPDGSTITRTEIIDTTP